MDIKKTRCVDLCGLDGKMSVKGRLSKVKKKIGRVKKRNSS